MIFSIPCCEKLERYLASEHSPLERFRGTGPLMLAACWNKESGEPYDVAWDPVLFCPFCGTRLQTIEDVARWQPRDEPDSDPDVVA